MAWVYCHISAMSGLKRGASLWYMMEPYPYGMTVGCYGLSDHVLHVLKPMYIIDRRGGRRASDAFLFAERPIT